MTKFEFDELKRRLNFSYNSDLGVLQHKTQAHYEMLYTLLRLEQITHEQFDELAQLLIEHFKNGLQDGINNTIYYIG